MALFKIRLQIPGHDAKQGFERHATRCSRLADTCKDEAVASKLRELAQDYMSLAEQPPDQTSAHIEDQHS